MKMSKIYEGWKNNLLPPEKLKKFIEATYKERISVCEGCPFHSKNFKTIRPDAHCTACGCTLSAKLKCLSCECPKGKWEQVITVTEEELIKKDGKA